MTTAGGVLELVAKKQLKIGQSLSGQVTTSAEQ
jgi:hypothetical protein